MVINFGYCKCRSIDHTSHTLCDWWYWQVWFDIKRATSSVCVCVCTNDEIDLCNHMQIFSVNEKRFVRTKSIKAKQCTTTHPYILLHGIVSFRIVHIFLIRLTTSNRINIKSTAYYHWMCLLIVRSLIRRQCMNMKVAIQWMRAWHTLAWGMQSDGWERKERGGWRLLDRFVWKTRFSHYLVRMIIELIRLHIFHGKSLRFRLTLAFVHIFIGPIILESYSPGIESDRLSQNHSSFCFRIANISRLRDIWNAFAEQLVIWISNGIEQ